MTMNRKLIIAGSALAALVTIAGCTHSGTSGGQAQENKQQQQDTKTLVNNQPIPHFNFSQYRQTLIDAESIAANGTQTTSFFFNLGARDPIFTCPSLGMPVPNTAQLSNPNQVVSGGNSQGYGLATIGQMDPYGAYTPSSSTGTYVICVNASGKPYLNYWEGFVQTVTAAATWDYAHHTLKVTGAPTYVVKTK
jgi:hypothetical protein